MNLPLQPKTKRIVWAMLSISVMITTYGLFQIIPLTLPPTILFLSVGLIALGILWGIIGAFTGKYRGWLSPLPILFGVGGFVWAFCYELSLENINKAADHGNTAWLSTQLDNAHSGPDIVDTWGSSLLMRAAQSGNARTVQELLRRGARTDYRDGDGDTALSVAESHHHQEIVALLKNAGARR